MGVLRLFSDSSKTPRIIKMGKKHSNYSNNTKGFMSEIQILSHTRERLCY